MLMDNTKIMLVDQMSESICDNEILSLYLDEHQSNVATNKYLQG